MQVGGTRRRQRSWQKSARPPFVVNRPEPPVGPSHQASQAAPHSSLILPVLPNAARNLLPSQATKPPGRASAETEHMTPKTEHIWREGEHIARKTEHIGRESEHIARRTGHIPRQSGHIPRRTGHNPPPKLTHCPKNWTHRPDRVDTSEGPANARPRTAARPYAHWRSVSG